MPTRPLRGRVSLQGTAGVGIVVVAAAITRCSGSFVLPVRIVRMFQVPQRAAAADYRRRRKVVLGRRRSRRPFERPRVPGIVTGYIARAKRAHDVDYEKQHTDALHQRSDRLNQVESLEPPAWLIGINASRHSA